MSSSTLKKVIKQKTHRERAQLSHRVQYGLLEKHKDYVLRAKDYHSKQDRLKSMQLKASLRNPDEFYFGMEKAKTKDGVHYLTQGDGRGKQWSKDELKLIREQDDKYLRYVGGINRNKIERLKEDLGVGLHTNTNTNGDDDLDKQGKPKHTIFLDDEEEVEQFDASKHFNTHPSLINNPTNRLTLTQLSSNPLPRVNTKQRTQAKESKLRELSSRIERAQKIQRIEKEVGLVRLLMGKGAKTKIGTDDDGVGIYKWRKERRR